jgi:PPOX class probable F420-dependent enzyme
MPKAPLPADAMALLRQPNPAVIAVVMPSGDPMSVATWYLVEDDGTLLVNMDAGRARLRWIERHPTVSLTALKDGEWYTHVSVRGPVVRWEREPTAALSDIDRLAVHYTGRPFRTRDAQRVSAWIRVDHWHGWDLT